MNNREVPSVCGQDMPNLKPLRNGYDQRVGKADILITVFFQDLFRADKVIVPEMLYNQLFLNQGPEKPQFSVLPEIRVQQVTCLRQNRRRRDQPAPEGG